MTIRRMDNVGIVVDDLEAAIAFFGELGMELEGEAEIEGRWADRIVGLDGVRRHRDAADPGRTRRLELTKSTTAISAEPRTAAEHAGHASA